MHVPREIQETDYLHVHVYLALPYQPTRHKYLIAQEAIEAHSYYTLFINVPARVHLLFALGCVGVGVGWGGCNKLSRKYLSDQLNFSGNIHPEALAQGRISLF